MDIAEEKQAQRTSGKAARRALSPEQRAAANAALCARLWQLDAVQNAQTILLYAAFGGEAGLAGFAAEAARRGKVLAIGAARSGLRGYLAVFGGVDTPPVLGSRSTDLKCRMGGLDGRALKAGDVLPIGAAPAMVEQRWQQICAKGANRPLGTARTPARPWRFLGGRKLPLFRAVPGPQTDAFTAVGQAAFVHGVYALTADCDRMACKLQGPQIETVDGSDIVSDGIVAGSVQVSANGQPIVMLADHQTTGGYAKIATVISADLSAMAQLRPGEKLAFQYVTAAQAVAGARAQAAVLDKIRERMK